MKPHTRFGPAQPRPALPVWWLATALLVVVCLGVACAQQATGQAKLESTTTTVAPVEVDAKTAKELVDKGSPLILDVRTEKEYKLGHLKDAVLIPVNQLSSRWTELKQAPDKEILVYCHSGRRSHSAAWLLADKGFTDVKDLKGGIVSWQKAGYPTVK